MDVDTITSQYVCTMSYSHMLPMLRLLVLFVATPRPTPCSTCGYFNITSWIPLLVVPNNEICYRPLVHYWVTLTLHVLLLAAAVLLHSLLMSLPCLHILFWWCNGAVFDNSIFLNRALQGSQEYPGTSYAARHQFDRMRIRTLYKLYSATFLHRWQTAGTVVPSSPPVSMQRFNPLPGSYFTRRDAQQLHLLCQSSMQQQVQACPGTY